jgi:uncharacterized repeat protein (TIGR01451 family)
MITKHTILYLSIAVAAMATVGAISTRAAQNCVTQYGGSQYGTPCNPNDLVINKEVQKIGAKGADGAAVYVENLSVSDATASAGTHMTFRLTVKNNSNKDFASVEVKDIFPPYMSYPTGSSGITGGDVKSALYDPANRTLTMKIENLKAGESRQIIVTAKVDDSTSFPAGKSTFCVVNTAQVRAEGRFDEDTAQVCINNNVKGVSTLPKAGSQGLLIMAVSTLLGLAGFALVRKTA